MIVILYWASSSVVSWPVCKKVDKEKSGYFFGNQILHAELHISLIDGVWKQQKIRKGTMALVAISTHVNSLQQHLLPRFPKEGGYSKRNS